MMESSDALTPRDAEAGSFTLEGYRAMLRRTQDQYELVDFGVMADPSLPNRRFCILRHDIDVSPPRALAMARVEAELGIRSTYTVLMTGRFYNVFETETREILQEIAGLGHHLGLHFDAAWAGVRTEADLDAGLAWQVETLSRALGGPSIDMFSFHDPDEMALGFKAPQYCGLWNSYASVLQDNVSYHSDSNGHWRFRTWTETLDEQHERLHVLTHPEWWIERYLPAAERICTAIDERAVHAWQAYHRALTRCGRSNKSDVPDVLAVLPRALGDAGDRIALQWLGGQRIGAFATLMAEVSGRGIDPEAADFRAVRQLWDGLTEGRVDAAGFTLRDGFRTLARILSNQTRAEETDA